MFLVLAVVPVEAQPSNLFTYQGRLNVSGAPANGSYDLKFSVYDLISGGTQQGLTLTNTATLVSNGLFTAALDFGPIFPGADRWLEIAIRTNGPAAFSSPLPRQKLMPTPYAITAYGVPAGAITSAMLGSGTVTTDKIATGAVKGSQIDDAGAAVYQGFLEAAKSGGVDSSLSFGDLLSFPSVGGVAPTLVFRVNGGVIGNAIGFSGTEGVSERYAYLVQVSSNNVSGNANSYLGQPATLTFTRGSRTTVYGGIVTSAGISGVAASGYIQTFKLEPTIAYLGLSSDHRIFQNYRNYEVAQTVYQNLTGDTLTLQLTGAYVTRENLVQYAETAFNFFSRLLESEGIFYYFNHGTSPPGLILQDTMTGLPVAANSPYQYFGEQATIAPGSECIRKFRNSARQSTISWVLDGYNFSTPATSLTVTNNGLEGTGQTYEYLPSAKVKSDLQTLAGRRQGSHNMQRYVMPGASSLPDLHAGYTFTLTDSSLAGGSGIYMVTSVRHSAFVGISNGAPVLYYGNQFEVIPTSYPYRPALKTPRPIAQPSTANVTGPAGETIHVDSLGRVKVQFHWDRYGASNDTASAWLRVTSPMAGANHAMMFLPRVGDEVLVSFLGGDPDSPIVTGSMYNAAAGPPYGLPTAKNVSTIKSIATDGQVNELKFDDSAGAQALTLHAARDLSIQAVRQTTIASPLSINGGTIFTNVSAGQAIVGSCATYQTNIPITFSKTFTTVPKITATPHSDPNWVVNDTFAVSVRSATTTGCVLNVVRVDSSAGWSQILRVNWFAWE
jgi:type VI secretion system secreted protein VgrG